MFVLAVREDRMPGGRNSGAVYNLYKVRITIIVQVHHYYNSFYVISLLETIWTGSVIMHKS